MLADPRYIAYGLGAIAVALAGVAGAWILSGDTAHAPAAPTTAAVAEATPAQAVPLPPLCMSDGELSAVLKYAATGPIRFGAVRCGERFPDLKPEADANLDVMRTKHGVLLGSLEAMALAPFSRSFGVDGAKRRDARRDLDNKSTFQRIEAYSRAECKSHLAAIEGFGQLPDVEFDTVLTTISRQSWDAQRSAVPPCG